MSDSPPDRGRLLRDDLVPPGSPWSGILDAGQVLRIIDLEGHQGVDFLCYSAEDKQERYNAPNTLKAQQHLHLSTGTVLYSDFARPLMTLVEDSCGGHDTIGGCCSSWSNEMLYGVKGVPGCRENFLAALKPHGLGWRDLTPNINFFCSVPVHEEGRMAESIFVESRSKAGDFVCLRAEMPVLVAISNCPQVNNPCNAGTPGPIRVQIGPAAG